MRLLAFCSRSQFLMREGLPLYRGVQEVNCAAWLNTSCEKPHRLFGAVGRCGVGLMGCVYGYKLLHIVFL
jgi:hypothetical protein